MDNKNFLWNFYEDGITQSFINSFLTCRYQTYLEYCLGYRAIKEPIYWKYANRIHYVLEHVYKKYTKPTENDLRFHLEEFNLLSRIEQLSLDEKLENDTVSEVVFHLLRIYFKFDIDSFTNQYHTIATEYNFKIPYRDTFLQGKIDRVYEDVDERLLFKDYKCLSIINEDTLQDILIYDTQVNMYHLACNLMYQKHPHAYNHVIFRRPSQKFTEKDTLESYVKKVVKDISDRPSHYYKVIEVKLIEEEVDVWRKTQLDLIIDDIRQWYDNGCKSYMNPNALDGKYGKCKLYNLIISNGSESGLRKKTSCFEELE